MVKLNPFGDYIKKFVKEVLSPACQCMACQGSFYAHKSDCAVHNMPAYPNGKCDCRELAA